MFLEVKKKTKWNQRFIIFEQKPETQKSAD